MPEIRPHDEADAQLFAHTNTSVRKGGDVILEPEDGLEGAGDLAIVNAEGNPLGPDGRVAFEFAPLDVPDGWHAYLGTAPQGVDGPTRQTSSSLPIGRPSFLANQPVIRGDLPPSGLLAAKLPRPEKPLLVAEDASVLGYAASSAAAPYFLAYTRMRAGRHSRLSPPTPAPPVANGQSIRALLPTDVVEGQDAVGVWMTEPGKSSADGPGPFYLQREVPVSRYAPPSYDLTGPFRYGKPETTANETRLEAPGAPRLSFRLANRYARPGTYHGRGTWTDGNGESLPGWTTGAVTINAAADLEVGKGYLIFERPSNPPPQATGWRAYVFVEGRWNAVHDTYSDYGNEKPYPLSVTRTTTTGWSSQGDNDYAKQERVFLVGRDLPAANTSGIEDPTDPMETPTVFGVVKPPGGTYYGLVTETFRGRESVPSEVAGVTISDGQVPRLVRRDRVNRGPNGENTEVGADGLPLDQIIVTTNGSVYVEESDVVLTTDGPQTGTTTPSSTWPRAPVDVDPTKDWRVEVEISMEPPPTGAVSGSVEVVLEELTAAGAVTQTVIGSVISVGRIVVSKTVWANGTPGLPGGSVAWAAATARARVLVRFVEGSPKNSRARIHRRAIHPHAHRARRNHPERRRRRLSPSPAPPAGGGGGGGDGGGGGGGGDAPPPAPGGGPPPDPDPEPPPEPYELPHGSEVDAAPPPVEPTTYEPLPGVGLALVEWPEPDRPSSGGALLETKHDFETALPSGWRVVASGNGTASRQAGAALVGGFGLRSQKTAPGP